MAHKHRPKVKRKDVLTLLELFRQFVKQAAVVTAEDGLPCPNGSPSLKVAREMGGYVEELGSKSPGNVPSAVLRALAVADEYCSGVNADVGRLRDATKAALAAINNPSLSTNEADHDVDSDGLLLGLTMKKAADHDLGLTMGRQGFEGDPPSSVSFPMAFREGQQRGLKEYEGYTPSPENIGDEEEAK